MLSTSQRAPGIAVPVPGGANVAACLEGTHDEAELAQAMQQVKAGEAGTDDEDVDRLCQGN
jgi:hypothetical protein